MLRLIGLANGLGQGIALIVIYCGKDNVMGIDRLIEQVLDLIIVAAKQVEFRGTGKLFCDDTALAL